MSWYRVDDGFPDHRKVEKLEQMGHRMWADALALWLVAGCYCSKVGSGGVISRAKIDRLVTNHRALNRTIAALCDVGLWHEELHEGVTHYRFHDWDDCNPTEHEVTETKRKNAERQRKYRQKRARERNALRDRYETSPSRARVTRPAPSRPDHPPTSGEVARAREDHPPPGSDRTNGERASDEQTAGYLNSIRQQGAQDRPSGHQPGRTSNRRPHPRDETYTGGLLNPEAEQIHELLLAHQLPLNSPVGMANHIAGLLGPFGNNKLTVARVKLAIEAVARKSAAAAADLAPRSADEVRDHLLTFLRYSDARWKTLEQKLAAEAAGPGPAPDAPPYHHPVPEPELPADFKAVPMPEEFKAKIASFGVRRPPRKRTTAGGQP